MSVVRRLRWFQLSVRGLIVISILIGFGLPWAWHEFRAYQLRRQQKEFDRLIELIMKNIDTSSRPSENRWEK